jgi:SMC interacting uncharacterized protein involved in chromosome segregation
MVTWTENTNRSFVEHIATVGAISQAKVDKVVELAMLLSEAIRDLREDNDAAKAAYSKVEDEQIAVNAQLKKLEDEDTAPDSEFEALYAKHDLVMLRLEKLDLETQLTEFKDDAALSEIFDKNWEIQQVNSDIDKAE